MCSLTLARLDFYLSLCVYFLRRWSPSGVRKSVCLSLVVGQGGPSLRHPPSIPTLRGPIPMPYSLVFTHNEAVFVQLIPRKFLRLPCCTEHVTRPV